MTHPRAAAVVPSALPRVNADALAKVTFEQTRAIRRLAGGDPDTAVLLERLDQLAAGAVVVVVGETKKGKSSVVNALVGRPRTSPVAVGVATATYLVLAHGVRDAAQVEPATPPRREVALAELPRWVTVDGLENNPDARDSAGTVLSNPVRAFLDVPLLRDISIIDTPGVGGLDGSHAAQTLAAIRLAGAMLFVTDITVPLTAPEADFLTAVARTANLADVIIVANMADKLTPENQQAAVRDLRLRIKERLPQFEAVPIVPISALQAEKAATATFPQLARETLRESSGLNALHRIIRERISSRGNILMDAQRLQIIQLAASSLAQRATATIEAAAGVGAADQIADLPVALADLANDAEVTRIHLHADLGRLQRTLSSRIDEAVKQVTGRLDHDAAKAVAIEELEPQLTAEITRISDELVRLTATGIGAAFRTGIARLGVDDDSINAIETAMATATATAAADIELRAANPHLKTKMSGDSLALAALGATGGAAFVNSVGGTAAGVFGIGGASASAVLGPIGLVLGAGVVALNIARGRRMARAADSRAWLRERMTMYQRDANDALVSRIDDAKTLVSLSLREFSRARAAALKATHAAAQGHPVTPIATLSRTREQALAIAGIASKTLTQIGTIAALNPGEQPRE